MNTVLVVDDDPEIRDVIHVYLRNEGYHVLEAADGLEAKTPASPNERGQGLLQSP